MPESWAEQATLNNRKREGEGEGRGRGGGLVRGRGRGGGERLRPKDGATKPMLGHRGCLS